MGVAHSKKTKRGKSKSQVRSAHAPEASADKMRICQVILPDGSQVEKKVYSVQSAYEIKDDCLPNENRNLENYVVVLWFDHDQPEIEMNDGDEFGNQLLKFDHIILRERLNEARGNELDNAIKLKQPRP
ncbi:hypothetical protein Bpfe_026240 [Biomphalaria pfeifferi]|uniref:Uncharacterized protein n=1 Tax=Biomphalaria pfeifferi TaxID=112525 RepID=A0AAD8EZD3_BIOPF|nr:hypothetical protein Bpfe_026240 [Biomphalaria pfeifferi]